jgi:predicted ATPase/class 3 adenylate cyclase
MMVGMVELPTGTVTLLFSDIEGSTVLLSRLGAAYAEALDGQRRVLRGAWAEHGGTELGTEGDSFFVVFATADGAVSAAAQAQRELAGYKWPAGERVRVRMGIHTGTPTVHDGGYVGMDVHRAARIAGASHGGQVVVSEATAKLVGGRLPEGVALRDLGSHQLKDIARPERLFQLSFDDLPADFPPLKTLGASSTLPRPATPLVGRDGELAELTALLGSPQVQLVTLTGPGGSGKTRLAIALAQQLIERFTDGVYFVPLATVTAAEVMWTTIGEVLDVPPERRNPPGLLQHVAHRSSLLVLDNLEQVHGSDDVVTQLSNAAPQVVVIATSRRAVSVPGEHVHAVPPLELPDGVDLTQVENAGAVQLFVQHARTFKSDFTLSASNAAAVTEVCRRLDGLPLAIELAAARTRLLSPGALLARLDKALDIAATGHQAPTRQQNLRATIAWSYDLLNRQQRAFFRRLGVFAGGADLDAISAVAADILDGVDPLDLVADLVDASLATITEDDKGEPRVGMLQTIRAYALDQLHTAGELDLIRRFHAEHYLSVAQQLRPDLDRGVEHALAARRRYELEHDNVRDALAWTLQPDGPGNPRPQQRELGLGLCALMGFFWADVGYYGEGSRWLQRAISLAGDHVSADLAQCLLDQANLAYAQGDLGHALISARRSVALWQRLGQKARLSAAFRSLGFFQMQDGDLHASRDSMQQGILAAEEAGDRRQKADILLVLADLEANEHRFDRAIELYDEALALLSELRADVATLWARQNRACTLREMGRLPEAAHAFNALLPQALHIFSSVGLITLAEDYGAVLADLGEHSQAVRLLAAAEAMRIRHATPRPTMQETEIAGPFTRARVALSEDTWHLEYQTGHQMTVEQALSQAREAMPDLASS